MAQGFSRTGLMIGMMDGSVRFLSAEVSPNTWNAAVHPQDGKELGADWDR